MVIAVFVMDEFTTELHTMGNYISGVVDLEKMKDGLFKVRGQAPGDFQSGPEEVSVSSGQLEGSSANAMDVMVDMINGTRSFEMKMKLVKELGDLGDSNNTLMRLA